MATAGSISTRRRWRSRTRRLFQIFAGLAFALVGMSFYEAFKIFEEKEEWDVRTI
jgi:hypothetical protein